MASGTYTVQVVGLYPHFISEPGSPSADKLISVEQWGNISWQNMSYSFNGAVNMTLNASDVPDLSQVTDMKYMFNNAQSFNGDLSNWDVSHIGMDFTKFLSGSGMSSYNYEKLLVGWDTLELQDDLLFEAEGVSYLESSLGAIARQSIIDNDRWIFKDDISVNKPPYVVSTLPNLVLPQGFSVHEIPIGGIFDDEDGGVLTLTAISSVDTDPLLDAIVRLSIRNDTLVMNEIRLGVTTIELIARNNHGAEVSTSFKLSIDDNDVMSIALPDLILGKNGLGSVDISMSDVFQSVNLLRYRVESSPLGIVSTSLDLDKNILTLTGLNAGVSEVTITAIGGKDEIDISFLVTVQDAFITEWHTTSSNEVVIISTEGGSMNTDYDFFIDWGDGSEIQRIVGDDPNSVHVYSSPDTFLIQIAGVFPRARLNSLQLLSVEQWGDIAWEGMNRLFYNARNMLLHATDTPDVSNVTDMAEAFRNVSNFDFDLSGWDVSKVRNMHAMFQEAEMFRGNGLEDWDVSDVTDMSYMFYNNSTFNSDLNWNVSGVQNMHSMFLGAIVFNGNLSGWNTAKVTNMDSMFSHAHAFNQDISDWNVSNVTSMNSMFLMRFCI